MFAPWTQLLVRSAGVRFKRYNYQTAHESSADLRHRKPVRSLRMGIEVPPEGSESEPVGRSLIDWIPTFASTLDAMRSEPSSRSFTGIRFTIIVQDDEERLASEARQIVTSFAETEHVETCAAADGVGWGGDVEAISFVLEFTERIGGVAGGAVVLAAGARKVAQAVTRLYQRLRKHGKQPLMSLGALTALCFADLIRQKQEDWQGFRLHSALDLDPAAGGMYGHGGYGELYLVMFTRADESWVYVVTEKGQLISRSRGAPISHMLDYYDYEGVDFEHLPEVPELDLGNDENNS